MEKRVTKYTVHSFLYSRKLHIAGVCLFSVLWLSGFTQLDSSLKKVQPISADINEQDITKLVKKYGNLQKDITDETTHLIQSLQKKEQKLKNKLQSSADSSGIKQLLNGSQQFYQNLQNKLNKASNKITSLSHYIPGLDSIQTLAKFLQKSNSFFSGVSTNNNNPLSQLSNSANGVQASMQSAAQVNQLLGQRQQQLVAALQPLGLTNHLTGFNKQVFYYQQQLGEYESLFHDQQKMEQKLLATVRDLPAFQQFMAKNSMLAQLFPKPGSSGNSSNPLPGLQTQTQVNQQLEQQMGSTGNGGAQNYLQQQIQAAQSQLNQLKDKLNAMGGGNSTLQMPANFTPNTQKTKSFLKRLEYGINVQTIKTNNLLPATSDIALMLGYKISDKNTIGVGSSYKLGWGNGLNQIKLSNQGIGLRSFVDMKLKGSIWITGGYEENWLPQLSSIAGSMTSIPNPGSGWANGWQQSGLLGLEKKYKIGKKAGNFQMLWNFLSDSQLPGTPALVFRVGYSL